MTSVMWFRRDLRLADNPALVAAAEAGDGEVVPLFVQDPALWHPAGQPRRHHLTASLRALAGRIGDLQLRRGDPVEEVVSVARAAQADTVHVAADFGPYGTRRDRSVEEALARHDIALVRTGSSYAVNPGRVRKGDGEPYQVFTPFSRAWRGEDWGAPFHEPEGIGWLTPLGNHDFYALAPTDARLPKAGEVAALDRWESFVDDLVHDYGTDRDRPDLDRTSRMSPHLKWGEIHPRTLLADLAPLRSDGARTFTTELAWREFYADVLWHHPDSARHYLKREYAGMPYDAPGRLFDAWREGRTGYPIVDAGMRQLLSEGWMHNRLRMIVASFLVKDLHVEWQHGARHFLQHLVDGDLASNQHGWQWVAGSGTDAAPYFRIFNPVTQGKRFDPDGDYVRRHVPELRSRAGAEVHEPWLHRDGLPAGYPEPVVEHADERREALRRHETIRSGTGPE